MAKIALGTWAWGAGAFGGDKVFGSKTDVENLKPVFDAAMKAGLSLWDTATAYVAPQVLTQSLQRMKQYLPTEADLAPYKDMILWKNAQQLFQIRQ